MWAGFREVKQGFWLVEHGARAEKGWCWHLHGWAGKLTLPAEVEREFKGEAMMDLEAHSNLKCEEHTISIFRPYLLLTVSQASCV